MEHRWSESEAAWTTRRPCLRRQQRRTGGKDRGMKEGKYIGKFTTALESQSTLANFIGIS